MIEFEGWILDVSTVKGGFLLWFKTRDARTLKIFYPYKPCFYAYLLPESEKALGYGSFVYDKLIESLYEHEHIASASIMHKFVETSDSERKTVLEIRVSSPSYFSEVVESVRSLGLFRLFNTDIPLAQLMMYETDLFPFCYCKISASPLSGSKAYDYISKSIVLLDDTESIDYEYPPLRVLWIRVYAKNSSIRPTKSDPIARIELEPDPFGMPFSLWNCTTPDNFDSEERKIVLISPEESWLLEELVRIIKRADPDILLSRYGDEEIFPYLLARAEVCGVKRSLTFSRDGKPLSSGCFQLSGDDHYMSYGAVLHRARTQFYLNGRLHIDSSVYGGLHFDDGNLHGIIEISRISRVLAQRLTRITIGGALSSLQFYYAIKNDVLIPEEKKNSEDFRSGYNLLMADRGGFIYQPTVGFFSNISEIDFSSMYPSIMVKYNISPETLNCKCCVSDGNKVPGLDYHTCIRRTGIVPLSINLPLVKRLKYKARLKTVSGDALKKYENINSALKWILVVCFGYLGFRNARFGRIEAHQTVCAYSREFLLRTSEVAASKGYRVLHGIVDSLWLQSTKPKDEETMNREIREICSEIETETRLPINFDPTSERFKFIIFLPSKQFEDVGALNRYWGLKMNEEVKVRGIELRRHDAPKIVKEYQKVIMNILSEFVANEAEFQRCISTRIRAKTLDYFRLLESGTVSPDRLAVTTRVTRGADEYKVDTYQAVASKQLSSYGIDVRPGQSVKYIITDADNEQSSLRVVIEELYSKRSVKYDVEKYKELLLRALKNMIPYPLPDDYIQQDSSVNGLDRFLLREYSPSESPLNSTNDSRIIRTVGDVFHPKKRASLFDYLI